MSDVERTARQLLRQGGGRMILAVVDQGRTLLPVAESVVDIGISLVALLQWARDQPAFAPDRERIDQFLDGFGAGRFTSVRTVRLNVERKPE